MCIQPFACPCVYCKGREVRRGKNVGRRVSEIEGVGGWGGKDGGRDDDDGASQNEITRCQKMGNG